MADELGGATRLASQCKCGIDFYPTHGNQVWCTRECAWRHSEKQRPRRIRPSMPRTPILSLTFTCVVCESEFHPKEANRSTCCSRECGFELKRRKGAASRALYEEIEVYRKWAKRTKAEARAVKPTWQERYEAACIARAAIMAERPCLTCGQAVSYTGMGRPRLFCSDACIPVSDATRRLRRAAKARRRAIERGIEADRFDPIEVLERDGWRCHICRCRTPQRLRGSYHPRAPELDHIVPLAQGGKHTRANTACSCRQCNIAKGATARGQLPLFA